jgi:hypothetical protein
LIQPQPHERVRRGWQRLQRARLPFRITPMRWSAGSTWPWVTVSSSLARAPVEIQNASSARSRWDGKAANSSLNRSSGIALGMRLGALGWYGADRDGRRHGCIGLWWLLICSSPARRDAGNGLSSGRPSSWR